MPKQHSFAVQKDTVQKDNETGTKIVEPPLKVESVGETIGWVGELLEAVAEFPWLLILLFPFVLWAAWTQRNPKRR